LRLYALTIYACSLIFSSVLTRADFTRARISSNMEPEPVRFIDSMSACGIRFLSSPAASTSFFWRKNCSHLESTSIPWPSFPARAVRPNLWISICGIYGQGNQWPICKRRLALLSVGGQTGLDHACNSRNIYASCGYIRGEQNSRWSQLEVFRCLGAPGL
jgi:hypothetical protein